MAHGASSFYQSKQIRHIAALSQEGQATSLDALWRNIGQNALVVLGLICAEEGAYTTSDEFLKDFGRDFIASLASQFFGGHTKLWQDQFVHTEASIHAIIKSHFDHVGYKTHSKPMLYACLFEAIREIFHLSMDPETGELIPEAERSAKNRVIFDAVQKRYEDCEREKSLSSDYGSNICGIWFDVEEGTAAVAAELPAVPPLPLAPPVGRVIMWSTRSVATADDGDEDDKEHQGPPVDTHLHEVPGASSPAATFPTTAPGAPLVLPGETRVPGSSSSQDKHEASGESDGAERERGDTPRSLPRLHVMTPAARRGSTQSVAGVSFVTESTLATPPASRVLTENRGTSKPEPTSCCPWLQAFFAGLQRSRTVVQDVESRVEAPEGALRS